MSSRPAVTVITPTRLVAGRLGYLAELYRSLATQRLQDWEWILTPDGADPALIPASITADRRVRINPMPRQVGAACARNLSLVLAAGDYVTYVDDDDLLIGPDSLGVRYRRAEETGLGWVAGQRADLTPDGILTVTHPLAPGHYRPGAIWQAWASPADSAPPLGHTQLLIRTNLALRSGQGGLIQGEDYVTVILAQGQAPGEVLPDIVYGYRVHDLQMTRHPTYGALELAVRRYSWLLGKAQLDNAEESER